MRGEPSIGDIPTLGEELSCRLTDFKTGYSTYRSGFGKFKGCVCLFIKRTHFRYGLNKEIDKCQKAWLLPVSSAAER